MNETTAIRDGQPVSATSVAPNNLEAFWMPFTANRQFKQAPRMFVGARDMHYTTSDGRQVLDATAGFLTGWSKARLEGGSGPVKPVRSQVPAPQRLPEEWAAQGHRERCSGMDAKVDRRSATNEPRTTRIQAINRGTILEAALEVFSQHGFRGSTIDQIATRAGMSKPNLLYYFKRKQDIYAAVLEATLDEWLTPLEDLDPNGDPIEELRRYITRKIELSTIKPEASRLFAGEMLSGAPAIRDFLKTRLRALVHEKAGVIRAWVSQGRLAPVDPFHLLFAIWATTQTYADFDVQIRAILGSEVGAKGFREQSAQAVLTIILNGIRPRG